MFWRGFKTESENAHVLREALWSAETWPPAFVKETTKCNATASQLSASFSLQ